MTRGLRRTSWYTLASSAIVAAWVVAGTLRVNPLPRPLRQSDGGLAAEAGIARTAADPAAELTRDPFRAGGRLPNELVTAAATPETALPVSVAAVGLLGTVVRAGGGFALCQLPGDVPRIVHLGEKIGELTLVALEQGRAVFQAPRGARLELTLTKPRS